MKAQYRIVKYHHGFFDKWAYSLEERKIFKFLFWTFEQWVWKCGNAQSTEGDARRWQMLYDVKEITPAPEGYQHRFAAQNPKIIRSGRHKVRVYLDPCNRSDAFLYRRFLFLWVCVKHHPIDSAAITEWMVRRWVSTHKIPDHMVKIKQTELI